MGWTYHGGILDEANHGITANIQTFGEYAVLLYDHPFTDLANHWSQSDVNVLVSRHIVDGVSEEHFEPDRTITRAEMTKLLVQFLGYKGTKDSVSRPNLTFKDVANDAWYASYVAKAAELGLVEGSEGLFRPKDAITREELIVMIVRALGLGLWLKRRNWKRLV